MRDRPAKGSASRHPGRAISPRARRACQRLGIDAALLAGSGPNGRIVEADVVGTPAARSGDTLSPMRRSIARTTALAASTIPHFYLQAELDASALVTFRAVWLQTHAGGGAAAGSATGGAVGAAGDAASGGAAAARALGPSAGEAKQGGPRLTFTDLLLKAQAMALREFPQANRIWKGDTIVALADAGAGAAVGLVVSLDDGLLIPVLTGLDRMDLGQVATARAAVAAAARGRRLRAEHAAPAATSLSNLGTSRVDDFLAVISPPQSSILSVGRLALRPWVVEGKVIARPTLRLGLAVDHRVMDGLPAATFLGTIIDHLENPARLEGTGTIKDRAT